MGNSCAMSEAQEGKCHGIIHAASSAAGAVGFGLAQVPFADHLVIGPIQVAMVISLGRVFGVELTESVATSMCTAKAAEFLGRSVATFLVSKIPGIGNCINAATAATFTESLGWMIANDFAKRQSL